MVKCPATCSDLSNRVYKPFWLIQLGNTMEDIDESEARRRHTVSANAKGEKEVPFRSTPITTRGAQSGPLLKRVQISSNDLAKIKESANYEDGEDQDAEKGLDLYAVLDSYFESWAICSTESPEDRGLAPCQSHRKGIAKLVAMDNENMAECQSLAPPVLCSRSRAAPESCIDADSIIESIIYNYT
ncbi:hypothetical protein CAPTEDRAFT_228915 [Capitella teleta]|uniref:Uncharacterized protein n=1 Tax=Capitella teleta TaxID=283909 RepID=R7VKW1_CAPTE|nr:hypothetical protein CAPTEDRAFT_228915 [Capitella teleta]|eukprot:ELU17110.1 hypothetical protein CAPTEDRAFT_228915 [Capitella teleta]